MIGKEVADPSNWEPLERCTTDVIPRCGPYRRLQNPDSGNISHALKGPVCRFRHRKKATRHEHQPSDLDPIPPPKERTVEVPQEQDGWDYEDQVSKPSDQRGRYSVGGKLRCHRLSGKRELALESMSMTAVVLVVVTTT